MSDKGNFHYDPAAPTPMYGEQPVTGGSYYQDAYYSQYPDGGYPQQPAPGAVQPYYQPQYGGYTTPGYVPTGGDDNGAGTAALVLGIIGIASCLFPASIAAVICGHIGMRKAREGRANNHSHAKAGIITGYIGIGLWVAVILFYGILLLVMISTADSSSTP